MFIGAILNGKVRATFIPQSISNWTTIKHYQQQLVSVQRLIAVAYLMVATLVSNKNGRVKNLIK